MEQTISTTVEATDYRTHTNRLGEGNEEAILFLHGSGPGATAWSNWQHALPALEDRYDCIAPDLIGFGKSTHPQDPPTGASTWMRIWIEQQVRLLDALGVQTTNVVGNSLGGALALRLLREHPERFERAVLMGTPGLPMRMNPQLDGAWGFYDDPTPERMTQLIGWFAYDPAAVGGDLEGIAKMRMGAAMDPDTRRSFSAMFPRPRQEQLDALALPDEEARSVEHPVLLIHGRDDVVVPLEASLHLLGQLPRVQLHAFGRCSHWTMIEYKDAFNRLVADFFGGEM